MEVRLPAHDVCGSDPARFREREANPGLESAPLLWSDAMEQAEEDWALSPVPLSDDGKPLEWRARRYNVYFRPYVLRAERLRDCGDLERSVANSPRTVETPIHLISYDNIAYMSQLITAAGWVAYCLKPIARRRTNNYPSARLTRLPLLSP